MLLRIPERSMFCCFKEVTIKFETYIFNHKIVEKYLETIQGIMTLAMCKLK